MKHPVDDDLKSICNQITAMGLSSAELGQRNTMTFYRRSCMCVFLPTYRKRGAFLFQVKGVGDFSCSSVPLSLEEILKISNGQVREIEIEARVGVHPEVAGMRRVEVDFDVLTYAINDAINVYVRDVLIPRGMINTELLENDSELVTLKHHIADHVAEMWRVSWVNDAAE